VIFHTNAVKGPQLQRSSYYANIGKLSPVNYTPHSGVRVTRTETVKISVCQLSALRLRCMRLRCDVQWHSWRLFHGHGLAECARDTLMSAGLPPRTRGEPVRHVMRSRAASPAVVEHVRRRADSHFCAVAAINQACQSRTCSVPGLPSTTKWGDERVFVSAANGNLWLDPGHKILCKLKRRKSRLRHRRLDRWI
jgi:hypothetical protein